MSHRTAAEEMMVKILLLIAGLLAGAFVGAESGAMLGAALGALAGWFLSRFGELQDRITRLERVVVKMAEKEPTAEREPPAAALHEPVQSREPADEPARIKPEPSSRADGRSKAPDGSSNPVADLMGRLFDLARTWLTTGNVPVKLGVIVSFFGVAFLLKYAVDRQLLLLPVEFRLAGVSAFGIVLLAIGWRLRLRVPVYALSLQGGGVGVLYLTIFAAMRFYDLLPAGPAFALLIALTVSSGALAIMQESRALAILGTVGGFLAPILVSTGSGDHVTLFSYYLVLNAAVLGIAWFRSWRELNIIGFVFTFIIGGVWGYENYRPDLFASTEPFLLAYFFFYQTVAILFALRQAPDLKGVVDGTLVFGTPVVAFALQARLVADFEYGLAISAVVAALMYAGTAIVLFRARSQQFRLLVESFLALGVAFATIAIPLALDARWTAAAWALEGAALIWIGVRQNRRLARLVGATLLMGSGLAFANHGWQHDAGIPILNGNYLGGMLIGLASLFSARYLERANDRAARSVSLAGLVLFFWGVAWCLGSGMMEIADRVSDEHQPTLIAAYLGLAVAALLAAGERFDWTLARGTTLAYLPALLLPLAAIALTGGHPSATLGWAIWPAAFGVQYVVLWTLRNRFDRRISVLHAVSLLALTLLVMWECAWQIDQLHINEVWTWAVVSVVPGLVVFGLRPLHQRFDWPVAQNETAYLGSASGALVAIQLLIVGVLNLSSNGDPAPLAYIPMLNPLDLASCFALSTALRWLLAMRDMEHRLTSNGFRLGLIVVGTFTLAISTAILVRAIHHLVGVPWAFDLLFRSVFVQSALSIYWGILGFSGMIAGARTQRRIIWLVGSGLMAVVVAKLFLIDLGNTGTVARIVSFIGTGALLLVVGYLAPVPPRVGDESTDDRQAEDA